MNVAYIPVRGGSKSIPLKNIKLIAGKPLVYWTVRACVDCDNIDVVYVATDSRQIGGIVSAFGYDKVKVIGRSKESATDTASTEYGMLEFAQQYEFDNIALVQATSPLLTAGDLSNGFVVLQTADSVLSVVEQKRFIWSSNGEAQNYDFNNRPRRQDFKSYYVENGAFYITSRDRLLETRCRLNGNVKITVMPEDSFFEIDEPCDWNIVEQLLKQRLKRQFYGTLNADCDIAMQAKVKIKMFLTDCDGTLTDGGMYYSGKGEEMKKFNTRDGVGLRLLREAGIITGIITGENSVITKKRGEKLGVDEIISSVHDKVEEVIRLCEKHGIELRELAYVGDDLNDLQVMQLVGLSACPSDAVYDVRNVAKYITNAKGGAGAVREVADYILDAGSI